ncbi:MAG: HNH endonuclease signature motif containing protein [Gammaproteobacteria bacterium]|nr:HNH endonuclease signature motif containing protein [Gammaproteobacteria bacterium]
MPAAGPKAIIQAIKEAFIEASASAVLISDGTSNPRKFYVTTRETSFPVWVYIWTLTHGGGAARPQDEYRIQLTSVVSPLRENPDGPTLLLGYEPESQCFAGFDLNKHLTFSTQSPSIQININTLREADKNGLAFSRKGNDEIAVGFRADNILLYSLNSKNLHESGADAAISELLSKADGFKLVTDDEINTLTPERKRVLTKVLRLARDGDFRRKVIDAYSRRCCVTGLQLRLIDAAHILPVGAPGSSDDVQNGLCLSPTYHRAYDLGLIYLTEDRKMMLNHQKREEFVRLGLGGGLQEFKLPLDRGIFLPGNKNHWPSKNFIEAANRFRAI